MRRNTATSPRAALERGRPTPPPPDRPIRWRRQTLAWGMAAAVGASVTACSTATGTAEPTETARDAAAVVAVQDNVFDPSALQIEPKESVMWRWEGTAEHNVVGDDFSSATMSSGTYSHEFHEPGDYRYVCTLHPDMTGSVTVGQQ